MPKTIFNKFLVGVTLLALMSACSTTNDTGAVVESVAPPAKAEKLPSAAPLSSVSERDILFAQTALKQLGYRPGVADGIWGDRSANAMRAFEKKEQIESARGMLSRLNLYTLSKSTRVLRSAVEDRPQPKPQAKPKSLDSVLAASEAQPSSPTLVILDTPYPLLAKANPYSEVVTTLKAGTGVYVLRRQGEWFEVESEEQDRGFIKDDL